ncbi:ABC transporter permease [Actinobacteria bacterium YIM 96077]|uniref:ABC transporter permease n=1 Tax=Phytoactinopolyspora halophila TaxID=1981511 RepID=A0A329R3I4_9ACTN|nr:ABC transporter permease [Phytoactinopolyspora halophila]AYY11465.1 ABC transporter permease [Actinobacteria bacterium YIM 96077]RAW18052.1 ABC transporter permease [Phytoactinopolyspora halophila]
MDDFLDAWRWIGDAQNWSGSDGVPVRFVEHLWLTGASLAIACVIAIPIGLWLGHIGRGGTLAINISNVGRAIPTFAVLVLLFMTPLGLSDWSTIIALVLFGMPPVLTNTYVGMREVDRDAVDAARGMGMSAGQVVRTVELPLAMPLIMNGVRLAAVQILATATIAALVAGGGLGRIITAGFGRGDRAQMIAGAILVAVMALLIEALMEWAQRRVDPLRRIERRRVSGRPTTDDKWDADDQYAEDSVGAK